MIISEDNFEDSEFFVPYYRLKKEDIDVAITSTEKGQIKKHLCEAEANKMLKEINPDDYNVLILLGSKALKAIRKEPAAYCREVH